MVFFFFLWYFFYVDFLKGGVVMNLDKYLEFGHGISDSIFTAALHNDTKYIVKYFESEGDVHIKDEYGQSLLHLSTRNKAFEAVELLLLLGVNPNVKDRHLLLKGANPNEPNKTKQTPLHKACFKGSVSAIKLLLDYHADLFGIDENNSTIMHYAVRSKKIKAVKYIIERGAIINSLDIRRQSTLHYAAQFSRVEIVKYLDEIGINPYSKDQYKSTPLHLAVEHPDIEMVDTFLACGLTSYDKNKFNQSPYDIAILKNRYEAVENFIKRKNDKTYQSRLKRNPLTLSIIMNEFDKAVSLIDICNVNDKDIFGNSALFYAIMNQEAYIVERLLDNDASIYNIDSKGDDALYYATLIGDLEIIALIQTRQVDYTKKYGGYTVIEHAMRVNDLRVYELLKKGSEI